MTIRAITEVALKERPITICCRTLYPYVLEHMPRCGLLELRLMSRPTRGAALRRKVEVFGQKAQEPLHVAREAIYEAKN
jgi:hypothetical protein